MKIKKIYQIEAITKDKIKKWRYKNSCKFCGKKLSKNIAVTKCKNPKCKEHYHIPCAVVKGIIFNLKFSNYNNCKFQSFGVDVNLEQLMNIFSLLITLLIFHL